MSARIGVGHDACRSQGRLERACCWPAPCCAQIFVFFPEEDKVGVKTIKTFAERMRNEGVARAVMVTQVNPVNLRSAFRP